MFVSLLEWSDSDFRFSNWVNIGIYGLSSDILNYSRFIESKFGFEF